jgi:starvation-inducible DNA-binding protein
MPTKNEPQIFLKPPKIRGDLLAICIISKQFDFKAMSANLGFTTKVQISRGGTDSALGMEETFTDMNKTRNTLSPQIRKEAIGVLNDAVAELFDLFARIKQAHWNVRGTTFIGLHKLLDEFAARIMEHIDLAAERATALGGVVHGSLRESAKQSHLKKTEEPPSISGMSDWINELADVHASSSTDIRAAIKKMTDAEDFGTADLLTDILRALDLQLWLLEAHINRHEGTK